MNKLLQNNCGAIMACLVLSGCVSGPGIVTSGSEMISRSWDAISGPDAPEPPAAVADAAPAAVSQTAPAVVSQAARTAEKSNPVIEKMRRDLQGRLAGKNAELLLAGEHLVATLPSAELFEPNGTELRRQSFDELNAVVAALKVNPRVRADVYGHTDTGGDEKKNLELTQARALAVARYVAGQGVDAKRLTVTGFGSARPVAANDTAERRSANRRIEIQFSQRAGR